MWQDSLEKLPLEFQRRELPPNYDTDSLTKKELIGVVRDLQRRVRLMICERLLDGMVQSNGKLAKDGLVPSLHELCKTIYQFLHPGEASMSKATVRKKHNNPLGWPDWSPLITNG
jgi:hypothetical protein